MYLVNFTVLNKRGEQALSLTRSAHGRDHDMVREIGETAAQVLRGIVRQLARSRRCADFDGISGRKCLTPT